MALSSSNVFERIEHYVSKLGLIFTPLFFAFIDIQVDFRGVNIDILLLSGLIIAVAVLTKFFGCGLPAILFLKDRKNSTQVGIGMISRGSRIDCRWNWSSLRSSNLICLHYYRDNGCRYRYHHSIMVKGKL